MRELSSITLPDNFSDIDFWIRLHADWVPVLSFKISIQRYCRRKQIVETAWYALICSSVSETVLLILILDILHLLQYYSAGFTVKIVDFVSVVSVQKSKAKGFLRENQNKIII